MAPQDSDDAGGAGTEEQGVLANLPRRRPQRETARRAAARTQPGSARNGHRDAGESSPTTAPGGTDAPAVSAADAASADPARAGASATPRTPAKRRPARKTAARGKAGGASANGARGASRAKRAPRRAPKQEPVPLQGFETEGERVSGSVQPPGSTEFLAGALELAGEVARAGLSAGERLLRDALGRLPLA